jgi:hypothetical protein
MEQEERNTQQFAFTPRQFLGAPLVSAPPKAGHTQAAVQFIIPGLAVGKRQREAILKLCDYIGREIYCADLKKVATETTKEIGTLVAIAYYIPNVETEEAIAKSVDDAGIVIVERFLGMLSFIAGVRLVAAHTQTTWVKNTGSMSTKLEPHGRSGGSRILLDIPDVPFGGRTPPDNVFIALFWLRRALAERDPLDTYSALMVALQAIAREAVQAKATQHSCPQCSHLTVRDASVSAVVRELVVKRLGATPGQFAAIWKLRNAVVAHGNQAVDAGMFLRLTELKFEAADLCYKGIKLVMGLPVEGPPRLDPSFFVTSSLMYVE